MNERDSKPLDSKTLLQKCSYSKTAFENPSQTNQSDLQLRALGFAGTRAGCPCLGSGAQGPELGPQLLLRGQRAEAPGLQALDPVLSSRALAPGRGWLGLRG